MCTHATLKKRTNKRTKLKQPPAHVDSVQCGIRESKPDGWCEARSEHCTVLTAASGV